MSSSARRQLLVGLGAAALVEQDLPQEQVGAAAKRGLLGLLQVREHLAAVALGQLQPALLGVRARQRPLEPGAGGRVGDPRLELDQVGEHDLGLGEAALVGVGAREVDAEAHRAPGHRPAARITSSSAVRSRAMPLLRSPTPA